MYIYQLLFVQKRHEFLMHASLDCVSRVGAFLSDGKQCAVGRGVIHVQYNNNISIEIVRSKLQRAATSARDPCCFFRAYQHILLYYYQVNAILYLCRIEAWYSRHS